MSAVNEAKKLTNNDIILILLNSVTFYRTR